MLSFSPNGQQTPQILFLNAIPISLSHKNIRKQLYQISSNNRVFDNSIYIFVQFTKHSRFEGIFLNVRQGETMWKQGWMFIIGLEYIILR